MPDGRSIVYAAFEMVQGQPSISIRAIPADSGPSRSVRTSWSSRLGAAGAVEFSADGQKLHIKSHDSQGRASIWSVPLSGSEPRLLVHFPDPTRPSYRPAFTADGRRIYFTIEDRQSDIHVAEVVRK